MNNRSAYLAGIVVSGTALLSQYVFNIDLGGFVWGLVVMLLVFAAAFITSPSGKEPSDD